MATISKAITENTVRTAAFAALVEKAKAAL